MKKAALLILLIGLSVLLLNLPKQQDKAQVASDAIAATVHKSPTCGCCVGYTGFLNQWNYDTQVIESTDQTAVKQEHNIPSQMQSCHTTLVEGYFIEGHVPAEAIDKLLAERPDIDGIALPGMPSGSPGMPGAKTEDFIIYSLKDGQQIGEFMRI